jgi:hypothetical protein
MEIPQGSIRKFKINQGNLNFKIKNWWTLPSESAITLQKKIIKENLENNFL